jgi:hypothetical protein
MSPEFSASEELENFQNSAVQVRTRVRTNSVQAVVIITILRMEHNVTGGSVSRHRWMHEKFAVGQGTDATCGYVC